MAEWRVQGYVADSDDEDESQTLLPTHPAASPKISNNIHEIVSNKPQVDNATAPAHLDIEKASAAENYEEEQGKNVANEEKKAIGSQGLIEHQQRENLHDSVALAVVINENEHDWGSLDFDDVDELQRDHFKATPPARLEAEPLQGAQDHTSHKRLDQSFQSYIESPWLLSSSPLSSPCSEIYSSLFPTNLKLSGLEAKNREAEDDPDNGPGAHVPRSYTPHTPRPEARALETTLSSPRIRNLRHRNPIQLHPYQIESEKYRQILRARGVKPLRIAQMEAEATNTREQETQSLGYNAQESQSDGAEGDVEAAGPSSLFVPQAHLGDTSKPANGYFDLQGSQDDDLPDLNTLLRVPPRIYVGKDFKRRKIASPASNMPQSLNMADDLDNRAVSVLEDEDKIFDVPPSPPHSGSQTPLKAARLTKPRFRYPRRSSSPALPTPVTSSEPTRPPLVDAYEARQHGSNLRQSFPVPTSEELSVSSEASSEIESSSDQLQRAQRRIRGVLPASWLKLDLKSQYRKPKRISDRRSTLSPEISGLQRGVARPVIDTSFSSPDLDKLPYEPMELSEEDGSSLGEEDLQRSLQSELDSVSRNNVDDIPIIGEKGQALKDDGIGYGYATEHNQIRLGEATEDDRIDPMLPSVARPRARRRRAEKQETKSAVSKSGSRALRRSLIRKSQTRLSYQPKITREFREDWERGLVSRPPRLGILDAPAMRGPLQMPVPRFIKVASRTARARHDRGRHSPSRKSLRLATKRDDDDTSMTLRNWREGAMAALPENDVESRIGRLPLYPRSSNSNLPLLHSAHKPSKGTEIPSPLSSHSNSAKMYNSVKKPQSPQTSLNHLLQNQYYNLSTHDGALDPQKAQLPKHKPKESRRIESTLRASKDTRPAMLESQRHGENRVHAQALFERDLSRINRFDDRSGLSNVLRLFDEERRQMPMDNSMHTEQPREIQSVSKPNAPCRKPIQHRQRKRRPQQAETSPSWFGYSNAPIVVDEFPDAPPFAYGPEERHKNVLLGLGPFGTRYSDTFGITPLPTGTCCHGKSILGSGIFARSIILADPNVLNNGRGFFLWRHEQKNFRWGPWNDMVSSELGEVMGVITQAIQDSRAQPDHELAIKSSEQAISMLEDIIIYVSDHLSFLDCIDRLPFLQKSKTMISILNGVLHQDTDDNSATRGRLDFHDILRLRVSTLSLVLVNSLLHIAKDRIIPAQLRNDFYLLVQKTSEQTLKLAFNKEHEDFEACITTLKHPTTADYTIGEEQHSITGLVIVHHVLSQHQDLRITCLGVLQDELSIKWSDGVLDIKVVENYWGKLFTLLPFLEIDAKGILETGRRFKVASENWTLIKLMISPVLEFSLKNPRGQGPSFNAYCRAVFGRCLHLINGWGWRRCETIIGTLFDFFARNGMAHLRNEGSHGSPLFLEHLDKDMPLIAEPEDRGFHILLKIIGSGLKHMARVYSEKKIRDIVWRLMPNHGRFHPKERSIRQEDLDALRNHHDLLCTLYWASPPSCRPRLNVIRNLVNLEISHREACHISIRAWFNLIKFQLSTDEPVESLRPFVEWYDDLLSQIMRQHSLARTEAEAQFKTAQHDGGLLVSNEMLESNIARNQRQVEAILSDALICLKLAEDTAKNEEAATEILSTTIARVFELFDARRLPVFKVILQALEVVSAYANKILAQNNMSGDENEDSQDYGDWPALDEDNGTGPSTNESEPVALTTLQEPLRHLLSNCFGSDVMPDDTLLLQLVDVWIAVAQVLVKKGKTSWSDYIGRFGHDSWSSLRDTEQTRKYTVYYLAALIERNRGILRDHHTFFLTSWIGSLVERESLLKFQHRLTETLLNTAPDLPLINNLPFWADANTGVFQIPAAEFSERRLSVISSVLSNMRMTIEQAGLDPTMNATQLRQEYKDLLKHLMAKMKHNYLELGLGSVVRGAYVDFVHRVVESLQQHTSTICPIDRFFTDNGAFPLPATDPAYVVGQLRSYALRLKDPKTPKQLAAFLQSISERAAIDGQQPYLVGQLYTAMSNDLEHSMNARPTLRSFIIKAIVPAYFSLAFTHDCGWILALPYLQALEKVFAELFMDLDGTDIGSVAAVSSMVATFLDSVRQSLGILLYPSDLFAEARILKTVSSCFGAIRTLLPVLDYVVRLDGSTQRALKDIEFFKAFAGYVCTVLQAGHGVFASEIDDTENTTYLEVRNFAAHELRDTLINNWTCYDGQYYVTRGPSRREVLVDIGLYEEEKQDMLMAFEAFFDCVRAMPALSDDGDIGDRGTTLQRTIVDDMDILVF